MLCNSANFPWELPKILPRVKLKGRWLFVVVLCRPKNYWIPWNSDFIWLHQEQALQTLIQVGNSWRILWCRDVPSFQFKTLPPIEIVLLHRSGQRQANSAWLDKKLWFNKKRMEHWIRTWDPFCLTSLLCNFNKSRKFSRSWNLFSVTKNLEFPPNTEIETSLTTHTSTKAFGNNIKPQGMDGFHPLC